MKHRFKDAHPLTSTANYKHAQLGDNVHEDSGFPRIPGVCMIMGIGTGGGGGRGNDGFIGTDTGCAMGDNTEIAAAPMATNDDAGYSADQGQMTQ